MEKLELKPSVNDLELLRLWLEEEDKISNEGLFCNWNIIKKCFKEGRLALFKKEEIVVGFACYSGLSNLHIIDIFEIHPFHRGYGLGTLFLKKIESYFISKGIFIVELDCSPISSKPFWIRKGFVDMPRGLRLN